MIQKFYYNNNKKHLQGLQVQMSNFQHYNQLQLYYY
jgi:hypothetical protein